MNADLLIARQAGQRLGDPLEQPLARELLVERLGRDGPRAREPGLVRRRGARRAACGARCFGRDPQDPVLTDDVRGTTARPAGLENVAWTRSSRASRRSSAAAGPKR